MSHRLVRLPGVFKPRSDAWMLAAHLRAELRERMGAPTVLELCAGSGAIAIAGARAGARVTATDLSRRALVTARLNALLAGVRVETLRGDLFGPVAGRRFDIIVSNPPYLPGTTDSLPHRGPGRAIEGGRSGRLLLDRICASAAAHLEPGGVVLVVHSSLSGTDETLARFAAAGLEASVGERRAGPLGPLMRGRADELERRGLLAPGERREELVVVAGRRSA